MSRPDSWRVPLTRNPRVARIPASPRRGEARKAALISASHWGRRRGCRGAGSPGCCCQCWGPGRAYRDRRPRVGRARRPSWRACRRAVPGTGRWWCLPGWWPADRMGHSRRRVAGMAARSLAAASPGRAGPARSLCLRRRSGGPRE